MYKLIGLILLVFTGFRPKAQTVGVVHYTDEVQPGYVLFAPTSTGDVYLIDECGQKINKWTVDGKAGLMGRLDDKGSLLYTRKQASDIFNGGGIGGGFISYSWEGELKYFVPLADSDFHQHHDFVLLPNGNFLFVGWEYHSVAEAKEVGRTTVNEGGIWSETVREIKMNDGVEPEIVWEWRVWDHLIQDVDETLPNYGTIVENPQRININFTNSVDPKVQDWLHVNSLDYNEELDQIIVNCRNFSEFWIIDHSTTLEESSGSTGGTYGKGGDVLYRWGNPMSYNAGTEADRDFYAQHDAHWIPKELEDGGKIATFNNGLGRPEGLYSSIDIVDPLIIDDEYAFIEEQFGPLESEVLYGEPEGQDEFFFSSRISGSQRLRNGNTLICVGQSANFIEINSNNEIVWDYVNPAGIIITTQGDPPTNANNVFQTIKYYYDFEGFEGKDLTPGEKIEINSIDNCDLTLDTYLDEGGQVEIKSNVIVSEIEILNPERFKLEFSIYNVSGQLILKSDKAFNGDHIIPFESYHQGVYFLILQHEGNLISSKKLIKIYE